MAEHVRVLVVDDELAVCNSCVKTLSAEGYRVEYSLNGEEALEKIGAGSYDLVVTDLKMPKVDGMRLLETVKARWPTVNVIMITGYGSIRSAVEAIKLGAFDYIAKPFTADVLAGAAARALGLSKMRREEGTPVLYVPIVFDDLQPSVMESMWCMPEHAWVRLDEDTGTARVGLDALYLRLLGGDIAEIDLPEVGKRLSQGEACAVLTVQPSAGGAAARHNLWSPAGGTVLEINETVLEDVSVLARSPYGDGWLVTLALSNWKEDEKNLTPFREGIAGRAAQKRFNPTTLK